MEKIQPALQDEKELGTQENRFLIARFSIFARVEIMAEIFPV